MSLKANWKLHKISVRSQGSRRFYDFQSGSRTSTRFLQISLTIAFIGSVRKTFRLGEIMIEIQTEWRHIELISTTMTRDRELNPH